MIGLDPSIPAAAYISFNSLTDLIVPSSLTALLQDTLIAPGMCPALTDNSGTPSGANIFPEYSAADLISNKSKSDFSSDSGVIPYP